MMNEKNCIEVTNINFNYAHIPVLENIEFVVNAGEYLGIIGPNGGGKTTLLKIILGLVKPDSGEVRIFGRNTAEFKERYRIGYVPQKSSQAEFFFPATVEEVVKSGRTARIGILRRFGKKDHKAVEEAMETAGVSEYSDRLIGRLSGGERQRVLIARALAGGPSILILDEPAVGVDIASQEKFYEFLAHLNREHGITVIFVSHDVGVIAQEVDTILCLNHRMMCHGSPENLIKEEYLEKLYGSKVTSLHHRH